MEFNNMLRCSRGGAVRRHPTDKIRAPQTQLPLPFHSPGPYGVTLRYSVMCTDFPLYSINTNTIIIGCNVNTHQFHHHHPYKITSIFSQSVKPQLFNPSITITTIMALPPPNPVLRRQVIQLYKGTLPYLPNLTSFPCLTLPLYLTY